MGDVPVGRAAYVNYHGAPTEWHERVILGHVQDNSYVIVTPDFDMYVEDLQTDANNAAVRFCLADNQLPHGIDPAEVYGFPAITPAQRSRLLEEGALLTRQEKRRRGIGAAGAAVAVAVAAPVQTLAAATAGLAVGVVSVLAGAAGAWIADEPGVGYEVGDEFTLPGGAAVAGDRGLVNIGGDTVVLRFLVAGANITEYVKTRKELLSEDDRTLAPLGTRQRTMAEAVHAMIEVPTPAGGPQPIQGPRTAAEWLRTAVAQGHTSLSSRHNKWVTECGIKHTDRLCYEHEVLSKAIDVAMVWDNSNIMNLWAIELVLRRVQLLEFAVSEDPANPSYDGATHFMGSYDSSGGGYIAPSLQTYVAAELGKTSAILKEKRKAREAKLARGKGANKGDGKGKAAAP